MTVRLSSLALLPALLVAASSSAADDLSSSDRKKLVRAFEDYFEAQAEVQEDGGSMAEAREELSAEIADIEEDLDRPFLAQVDELQSILVDARERGSRVDGKGRPEEIEITFGDFETKAVVRAPKSYKGDKQLYPLVIVIPDSGQTAEEVLRMDWNQPGAVDDGVFCAVNMPADLDNWIGFGNGEPGGVYHVMPTFGRMIGEYSIDPDRVLLAGRGAGVAAAAEVAALFPDRFAGVVGIAGDLADGQTAHNFGAIDTLWIGGGANVSAFADQAESLGRDNVRSEPNLPADEIWTWVAEQRRTAHPEQIVFRPRDERAGDAYWLTARGIDMADAEVGLEASIDRESNTIDIQGSGVSTVRVSFNDALVDLSRPVRVVLNGVEHERQFDRNLLLMLGRLQASSDPGRIYTAQQEYDFEVTAE